MRELDVLDTEKLEQMIPLSEITAT